MKRAAALRSDIPLEYGLHIPPAAHRLAGFRAWAQSEFFPETGRIDYVGGEIDVDMSPEDLQTHGTPKAALGAELFALIAKRGRGYVFVDRTRVTSASAELSAEPDLVVVLFSSLDAGRVRQVPAARLEAGRFVELEGAPDLVVEIVSDSSEQKDTELLPAQYARAGVPEFWLLDARGGMVRFDLHRLAGGVYRKVPADAAGWVESAVLGIQCRIKRKPAPHSGWLYVLQRRRRGGGNAVG
jgi:Uma2 family endonuclease